MEYEKAQDGSSLATEIDSNLINFLLLTVSTPPDKYYESYLTFYLA